MTTTAKYCAAIAALLLTASPALAGSCTRSIAKVQARVDAAIEHGADSDGWKPESLDALRGYQPTPRSLAATEAITGRHFEAALDSLDRARAADRSGYVTACRRELTNARALLRR